MSMSIPRARPDTLQNIISSFKQFEKKLDKLQDDVNYHGQTLSEIHIMLANISTGNILSSINNGKLEDVKKLVHKTTAMRHDSNFYHEKPIKTKRRNTIQPLTSKLASKSFQGQRNATKANDVQSYNVMKMPSSPSNALSGKRARQRKNEIPRKNPKFRKEDKNQSHSPQLIF